MLRCHWTLLRNLLKISSRTSSTYLEQYLNLSLENYLISAFFIRCTSLKHPALCSHTE
uniref:PDIL1-4 n=1 Tax=Arundo donax TaxID=35708 RepID=A0A0A9CYJ3_ARUDO